MTDLHQPLTRRQAARLLGGTSLALVAGGLLTTKPASASRSWCRTDPVIKVDGQVADIYLSSYVEMHDSTTGPARIVITIPTGSTGGVYAMDQGFGGYGYEISFVEANSLKRTTTHTQVKVSAYVPALDSALPVTVTLTPRSMNTGTGLLTAAKATGKANAWVTLTTK